MQLFEGLGEREREAGFTHIYKNKKGRGWNNESSDAL